MPDPQLGASVPLVPPLYATAVYTLPDLDALDAIYEGRAPGFIYARDAHPNAHILANHLTALEAGSWGVVCSSGIAALSAVFIGLLAAKDRVVASSRLYGRTIKLLKQELNRYEVETAIVDTCDLDETRKAVAALAPKVLFVETMSNPLCRVADIPALADIAHAHGCQLVVDNTFATPVLCRPLELGADFVQESLTKMIAGHSAITLGFLAGKKAEQLPRFSQLVSSWGLAASPYECWQASLGLETLALRMHAATANASAISDFLAAQKGVTRVIYPGRQDHPDYELTRRLLPMGCGNMLCFDLVGGREAVNRFIRAAKGVPFSPSLGHVTTTLSYPSGTSHRYESASEKEKQGISDGLIRLSVGCEPLGQLQTELARGLASLF